MNHINKALLTAALGSSLLALEACQKWDTNRLEGRWKYVAGDLEFNPGVSVIFDFEKDGDFTQETIAPLLFYSTGNIYNTYTNPGEWEWAPGKTIKIQLQKGFDTEREFQVILIQGNHMELKEDNNDELIFRREFK